MQFPPIQPTGLRSYLSSKKLVIPKHTQRYFYMSWEDALWDLIRHFKTQEGSKILLPTFFCGDVVENMKVHGLVPVWYKVDRNFQTDPISFKKALEKEQPQIVIILHAVGITNQLFAEKDIWITSLSQESILIEDSVHRIVDPSQLDFIHERHVVLDSLRKVVPLAGSNVYGLRSAIGGMSQTSTWVTLSYQIKVISWWFLFQLLLILSTFYTQNEIWQKRIHLRTEKAMLYGYDIIGDSYFAGRGWDIFKWLSSYLDTKKIEGLKSLQVYVYKKNLKKLWKKSEYFEITISEHDYGKLRGYPVGIAIEHADNILQKLRSSGFITRFELNDSAWSEKQKVIYLPLGPHVNDEQIKNVCGLLISCL